MARRRAALERPMSVAAREPHPIGLCGCRQMSPCIAKIESKLAPDELRMPATDVEAGLLCQRGAHTLQCPAARRRPRRCHRSTCIDVSPGAAPGFQMAL